MRSEPVDFIKDLFDKKNTELITGDLTENLIANRLPKADYIIHAAGYGQPGRFMEDPIKTIKLNTVTTFNLFDKLLPGGKFLFISSSELYSGLTKAPFKESQIGNTNTTHPRSCYIEAKRCGEAIVHSYNMKGFHANSARLALAYGPGTRKGDKRVLNAFIERALLKGKIALQDQGQAKRTYCYISDAIEIMWHILLNGTKEIYNVGGESHITIHGLAESIGDYLHVPVELPITMNEQEGAPEDVFLDLSKIKTEFKKSKFIDLREGLKKTIEWQKILYKGAKYDE